MTQGELFGRTSSINATESPVAAPLTADAVQRPADGAESPAAAAFFDSADSLRRLLASRHGLWVDPFTAQYIAQCLAGGVEEVEFIAADARSGRSAFHALPASALCGDAG